LASADELQARKLQDAEKKIQSALIAAQNQLERRPIVVATTPTRQRFDAEKVRILRQTLLGILARYGRRMENLPENERLLLVVEAPAARSSRVAAPGRVSASVPPVADVLEERELGQRERALVYNLYQGLVAAPLGRPQTLDRYLISVDKADLMTEKTVEELEGRIREIRY
jgi:hypothetical protein